MKYSSPRASWLVPLFASLSVIGCATPSVGDSGSDGELNGTSTRTATQLVSGDTHSCALLSDGAVRCWGRKTVFAFDPPADLPPAASIESGAQHTCALLLDKRARCWGAQWTQGFLPRTMNFRGTEYVRVSAGAQATCVVRTDGKTFCTDDSDAQMPEGIADVVEVDSGSGYVCALLADRHVQCWTRRKGVEAASAPADLGSVAQLSTGTNHACAVREDGTVRCWGRADAGQLDVPSDLGAVTQVSAGVRHTCAVQHEGSVRCWGDNAAGQADVPSDLGAIQQVAAGRGHTCALRIDGKVRCWGADDVVSQLPAELAPNQS